MKGRYKIICDYFGLFDDSRTICVTDNLSEAVFIVEAMNKAYEDRPFDFDFKKVARNVDEALDFVGGESFLDMGFVCDCKNLEEYRAKYAENQKNKIIKEQEQCRETGTQEE